MKLKFLTVVIALAFLSGCTKTVTQDKYDSMESSYEQQISDLESKVASKQQYIETVNTSIQEWLRESPRKSSSRVTRKSPVKSLLGSALVESR